MSHAELLAALTIFVKILQDIILILWRRRPFAPHQSSFVHTSTVIRIYHDALLTLSLPMHFGTELVIGFVIGGMEWFEVVEASHSGPTFLHG